MPNTAAAAAGVFMAVAPTVRLRATRQPLDGHTRPIISLPAGIPLTAIVRPTITAIGTTVTGTDIGATLMRIGRTAGIGVAALAGAGGSASAWQRSASWHSDRRGGGAIT